MVHIKVKYGTGDRKAPVISDSLIPDEATATIRAKQELAKYTYIVQNRTLAMPHDPIGGVGGDFTGNFTFQRFSIYGTHLITSRTITLTPSSAKDEVQVEQYRELIL